MLREVFGDLLGEVVERSGVFSQLFGRACEGLTDARAELGFEHRKHRRPHSHARERRVVVLRVMPGSDRGVVAEFYGLLAPDAQQWTPVDARLCRHPLQARGAAAAREAQQHRLGLVVKRVAEQHGCRAQLLRRLGERAVASCAGRCLGAAVHPHGDGLYPHRVEPEGFGLVAGPCRGIRRPRLKPVVDDHRACSCANPGSFEGHCGGERQGVGAA